MLARVEAVLHKPAEQRESFSQFQQDWQILTTLREGNQALPDHSDFHGVSPRRNEVRSTKRGQEVIKGFLVGKVHNGPTHGESRPLGME